MSRMFFSHHILSALVNEGKITLANNILTILAKNRPSFELEPAYRFLKTADNTPDPHALVGQILYARTLKEMNAEAYMDSVIYKDTAYEVEQGFIGEKREQELMDSLSDTDLLARFLLESLL